MFTVEQITIHGLITDMIRETENTMKKTVNTVTDIKAEIERIKSLPDRIESLQFVEISEADKLRLIDRHGTTTNEHLVDTNEKSNLDTIANELTRLTEYRVNIDYNKAKLTVKADKLIARIYVTKNGYRISNYIHGVKEKNKAIDMLEVVKLITA